MSLEINKLQPDAIFIQLHTYCNAACINCPHDFTYKTIHPKGQMADSTWEKIINDIIEMNYSGQVGFYLHHEPLIDTSLFQKIVDINKLTNAYVVLSSNGALLTPDRINKLINSSPKKVHININSGIKSEYEESMGLNFNQTIQNVHNFIEKASPKIDIEINCPVMAGFQVESLKSLFPNVNVNLDFWANSRGGLLPNLFQKQQGSRFKIDEYCKQPSRNFNILFDGSVIICCMDWMHESKNDFPNVNTTSIQDIYNEAIKVEKSFRMGDYSRYKMCQTCSLEMGFNDIKLSDSMKILITNHHLLDFTGSEIYTFTLADYLRRYGHDVIVYSKFVDMLKPAFEKIGVNIVTDLEEIKNNHFDIAHIHHNTSAFEVRHYFPELPMVFLSHGVIPFLEQPPEIDLNISKFLAVSEEVQENLFTKIKDETKLIISRNIIDDSKFKIQKAINKFAKRALVLSNKIDNETESIIRKACNQLKIECKFVGMRFIEISQDELPSYINRADIVFTLGRGVIETMLCGRIPFVYDYQGGDGFVTPENYQELMRKNFSGRTYNKKFTTKELVDELCKYNADNAKFLHELTVKYYSANMIVTSLVNIYRDVIEKHQISKDNNVNSIIVDSIYNMVFQTRIYYEHKAHKENHKITAHDFTNFDAVHNHKKEETSVVVQNSKMVNEKPSLKALIELSEIQIKQQNYFEAYLLLQKVLKENPSHELALENIKKLDKYIDFKRKEKRWDSKKSSETLLMAESLIEMKNLKGAKKKLYEMVTYEPEHLEALNDLAVVSIMENNKTYAEELISTILRIDPTNEIALGNKNYLTSIL